MPTVQIEADGQPIFRWDLTAGQLMKLKDYAELLVEDSLVDNHLHIVYTN